MSYLTPAIRDAIALSYRTRKLHISSPTRELEALCECCDTRLYSILEEQASVIAEESEGYNTPSYHRVYEDTRNALFDQVQEYLSEEVDR